ncbi:2TM domain-containing protein [Flavobacterium pallidum]|uniref:Histidine kinase n=1 Tax=Flavobacterium pallidum TaxID=2172098 RepID=A0A2S1SLH6_9FLAO|nr:2TM domain-containing protein [Flavobacterium pallidum]AWI27248.1 histidine kinase [Flavobacterium pallidum]
MQTHYEQEERFRLAKKRVDELKGFYGNLVSYIVVNLGLMILNLMTSPEHLWFFWPMFGWGVGVLFHAMKVYGFTPFFGKDWEERKIRQFMEEEKKRNESFKGE